MRNDAWRDYLCQIAQRQRWPTLAQPERLAPLVRAVSAAYNHGVSLGEMPPQHHAARLGFFFARDVLKCTAAALPVCRGWQPSAAVIRVVDLGAGLGASGLGLVRALRATGHTQPIELLAVDADGPALTLAAELLGKAAQLEPQLAPLQVRVRPHDLRQPLRLEARADWLLCAQTLCELDRGADDAERARRHARLLADWHADLLRPGGRLLVVEPALAQTSRHLQRVRDALLAELGAPMWPCTHAHTCPMLAHDRHWCHQDADEDLPAWLQPVAKATGLRWQGLSWSAMAWGPGPTVAGHTWQVVSERLVRKGQSSVWLCGAEAGQGRFVLVNQQDRDRAAHNAAWAQLRRGVRVGFAPPLAVSGEQLRLPATTAVEILQ